MTSSGLSSFRMAASQRRRAGSVGAGGAGGPGGAGASSGSGILNADRRSASCDRLELLYKVTRPICRLYVAPVANRPRSPTNVSSCLARTFSHTADGAASGVDDRQVCLDRSIDGAGAVPAANLLLGGVGRGAEAGRVPALDLVAQRRPLAVRDRHNTRRLRPAAVGDGNDLGRGSESAL